jgi:uroporphyrinogen decarboxylase
MGEASQIKPIPRVLRGETVEPPPVWLMRQAGRYLPEYRALREKAGSFLGLCYTPELAAEVTLQPVRRFGLDAAILFSDILVICDALGQKVEFVEGEGPRLEPIRSADDLEKLNPAKAAAGYAPVLETVRRVKAELPAETALIGFAGAPWTVATYMIEGQGGTEFAITKRLSHEDPILFRRLIELLVEATTQYLIAQIDAGAELLQLFDSWAGALAEDDFEAWSIAPARAIVAAVKAARPGVPIIGFPRGAGAMLAPYAEETGVDAVSLDTSMPLAWAAKALGDTVALQGNLDPVLLLVGGAPLDAAITRIRQAMKGRRFIFNLGHGVLPATPPEHVERLVARLRTPL